jgi:hypothetical protein
MTIDELREQWAVDCQLNEDDLSGEALRIPMLHSKYLNELIQYKLKQTKVQMDIAQLRALKGRYFRGELTSEELKERGWDQWSYRTLKSDIEGLLEADPEIQVLVVRDQYTKTAIYFLESCMSELKNRNFAIKSAVEWIKFRAGN